MPSFSLFSSFLSYSLAAYHPSVKSYQPFYSLALRSIVTLSITPKLVGTACPFGQCVHALIVSDSSCLWFLILSPLRLFFNSKLHSFQNQELKTVEALKILDNFFIFDLKLEIHKSVRLYSAQLI